LGYITGKVLSGRVTDALGGDRVIPGALALLGLCLGIMGQCSSVSVLISAWFMARAFSASIWPAMGKLCRQGFGAESFARAWGLLSTSSRFGALCGGLLLAPVLQHGVSVLAKALPAKRPMKPRIY
jgi:sugar phosphate permease